MRGSQTDFWTYFRPLRSTNMSYDRRARSKPVFASMRHLRESNITLHVGSTGRPLGFSWRAEPGTTMAFLTRSFRAEAVGVGLSTYSPPASPTRDLVVGTYLQPGDVILGGATASSPSGDEDYWTTTWESLIVRRAGS